MYIATVRFADLQDNKRIYEAGEQYPRLGFSVSEERLRELAGSDNLAGRALIKAVETPVESLKAQDVETPVRRLRTAKKGTTSRKKG